MKVNTAFNTYQTTVNADPEQVREAKARRDLFRDAFEPEDDIVEVRPSGSLARGTQHDPIKDVDTILVYNAATLGSTVASGSYATSAAKPSATLRVGTTRTLFSVSPSTCSATATR